MIAKLFKTAVAGIVQNFTDSKFSEAESRVNDDITNLLIDVRAEQHFLNMLCISQAHAQLYPKNFSLCLYVLCLCRFTALAVWATPAPQQYTTSHPCKRTRHLPCDFLPPS